MHLRISGVNRPHRLGHALISLRLRHDQRGFPARSRLVPTLLVARRSLLQSPPCSYAILHYVLPSSPLCSSTHLYSSHLVVCIIIGSSFSTPDSIIFTLYRPSHIPRPLSPCYLVDVHLRHDLGYGPDWTLPPAFPLHANTAIHGILQTLSSRLSLAVFGRGDTCLACGCVGFAKSCMRPIVSPRKAALRYVDLHVLKCYN